MRSRLPIRGIFISALLLWLALLPLQGAVARQDGESNQLGVLAYIQSGDLWMKALPEGQAQRLTVDGDIASPHWSPSGCWLAFRKGEQVWLMDTQSSSARPLNGGVAVEVFAWAPAKDRLAYVTASGELQTINADGTDLATLVPQTLPDRGPGRVGHVAWSPDGTWLAYEWWAQQPDQPATYQGLWKVLAGGGERIELYASGLLEARKGEAILAGWSGDGHFLLFWQSEIRSQSILADGVPLYTLPAGGGTPVPLVEPVLAYLDLVAPDPTRSAQIAVIVGGGRFTHMIKSLHVVSASPTEDRALTSSDWAVSSPAWSPDGTRIAYPAMPDRGQLGGGKDDPYGLRQRRIWVVNLGGDPQPRQLTHDLTYGDEHPLWSADGSHLLFTRLDAEGRVSLWLIPAVGGTPQPAVDKLLRLPPGWFGYYGHIVWEDYFGWWRGTAPAALPVTGNRSPVHLLLFIGAGLALLTGLGLREWQRKRYLRLKERRPLFKSTIGIWAIFLILLVGCGQTTVRRSLVMPTQVAPSTAPARTSMTTYEARVTPTLGLPQAPSSLIGGPTATPTSGPTATSAPAEVLGIAPSPPSTDEVLLVRPDGAFVLHHLGSNHECLILKPGLYNLSGDNARVLGGWPVRLSPDGHWLLIPTPDQGTWLVSVDGQTQRQVNERRLSATWAPESRRIVFTDNGGQPPRGEADQKIYIQDVVAGEPPRLLARLPYPAWYPTWSPGCDGAAKSMSGDCGRSVATFSCESGDLYTCTVWLIEVAAGEVHPLGEFSPTPIEIMPVNFAWSPGGDEVWTRGRFDSLAFPVDGGGPRPLASACQPPCGQPSPDGSLHARAQLILDQKKHYRLVVVRADSEASGTFDPAFEQVEGVRWTSDGRRVLLNSYTGGAYTLWAVDPASGDPELVAEKIIFLGTLAELRRRSTEVGLSQVGLCTLPPPGAPSTWTAHDLPDLGLRLRAPAGWRFETRRNGEAQTVTLANFDFEGRFGSASLRNDQLEITFELVPSPPPPPDFTAWLAQVEAMAQNQMTAEKMTLAGRPAARVRAIVSPVSERVRVPLTEGELWITRRPLSSTQAAVFQQILDSLEFVSSKNNMLD